MLLLGGRKGHWGEPRDKTTLGNGMCSHACPRRSAAQHEPSRSHSVQGAALVREGVKEIAAAAAAAVAGAGKEAVGAAGGWAGGHLG